MLCEAMRATRDLELRENIVQLLWDLEAHNKDCHFDPGGRGGSQAAPWQAHSSRASCEKGIACSAAARLEATAPARCCTAACSSRNAAVGSFCHAICPLALPFGPGLSFQRMCWPF